MPSAIFDLQPPMFVSLASSGALSVSVSGRGLGVSGASAVGGVGGSACAASVWRSDSGLVCRTVAGRGRDEVALLSAGVQRGSLSAAASYDAPSVSSAGASNVASSGALSVSVSGRGLGVSGASAVGGVGGSAGAASVWRCAGDCLDRLRQSAACSELQRCGGFVRELAGSCCVWSLIG